MKKLFLTTLLGLSLALSLSASGKGEFEKKGFLTTKWCAENDLFADCRLETYHCGSEGCYKEWLPGEPEKMEMVLFVHDEGKFYEIDPSKVKVSELLEKAANRNEVTIIGELESDGKTIKAIEFKAPPPPKKSFFKGCL
ncbi:hypothetical protein [Nitrosophilus kaiyonis]|uniref:hypothetical protein n=1 Tax=Nitrosophilus kaiyonis TaxID=2930200 RepID=UPI002491703C|nr:hypothetical protein [Nitrosophilus kaiyonis]